VSGSITAVIFTKSLSEGISSRCFLQFRIVHLTVSASDGQNTS
jgi:hypothetical protein